MFFKNNTNRKTQGVLKLAFKKVLNYTLNKQQYETDFKNLVIKLITVKQQLEEIIPPDSYTSNSEECLQFLQSLVKFYEITSHWDDNRHEIRVVTSNLETINVGHYTDHVTRLNNLEEVFNKTGRDLLWNKTIKGDKIGPENIFLGQKRNLPLRTIKFWQDFKDGKISGEKLPSRLKNLSEPDKKNIIDIINDQARIILKKGRIIIEIINNLEKKADSL